MSSRIHPHLNVEREAVEAFCRRWGIAELALFGSVVRDDFGPDSDVDVMVEFNSSAQPSLFDLARMRDELVELFGRDVDIIERGQITNPFRRRSIERDLAVIYAA